ncbi:hypothetical protein [Endozoicomonas sp. GU-1]|uniref:outer membrane beta-barrel protein n=1 Tax=Endozoicomonas sp. GU-1 TaxID=3009078 RepID=UPI0022B492C9|nr:hypothetical protein [Endozoicomonas sp. GU-1]WBA83237.1 hypothetical protein O2T12_09025 [Endozoicomonas sp. GU-1]WBA86162.1 hypothetical protein O3276_23655 [Endozoicomonas sp. GU-1]
MVSYLTDYSPGKPGIKPMTFRILLISLLFSSSAMAFAGNDYNYTFINTGFGYNNQNQGTQNFDGTTWFVNGAYKVPSIPVILNAGYAYGRIDKDDIASNVEIDGSSYFAGASLLLKPTDRFHVIPSVTSGRLRNGLSVDADEIKDKVTAYTASVSARYHLEQGLWLNSGYIQQYYDRDEDDNTGFFTAGAEYQVDNEWAFGLNYRGNSDQYTTQFFVKLFF